MPPLEHRADRMAAIAVGRDSRDASSATSARSEYVAGRIPKLGVVYERLTHQVARGSSQAPGRSGRGEPPIPIRPSVVDLMDEIEQAILWLLSSACALLDWSSPRVKPATIEGRYAWTLGMIASLGTAYEGLCDGVRAAGYQEAVEQARAEIESGVPWMLRRAQVALGRFCLRCGSLNATR